MLERLFERIEDRRAALITLTQELVRIPTVNPPGDAYRPCAELIGNRLKARGFEVIYERGLGDPADSDRYPRTNIIARYQGRRPGPCVHFNGHIDVVEVGQGWTKDPFGGEIEDGKIYGRGTCDMKGGLAAAIIAVEAILDSDIDFAGALEISGTVDEETGGYGGVAYLAKKGYFSKPRVDHVIIPEPLNVDRVCIGHRGAWWAEVETHGRIAHGSMPFLGDCAVRHMGAFLAVIEQELIPLLASKKTEMPVVPAEAQRSTLNLNSLRRVARALRARLVPSGAGPAFPDRGKPGGGQGRGGGVAGATENDAIEFYLFNQGYHGDFADHDRFRRAGGAGD